MKLKTDLKSGMTNYSVQSGDSLAKIAQIYYGPNASADDVIRIYEANKQVIGPDPCVLQVGSALYIPPIVPSPYPYPYPTPPAPNPSPSPQPVGQCQEYWGNGVCLYKVCPYPPFTMECD